MNRRKFRRFLLPGIFLFLLGVGNILVGSFKEQQYRQVLSELSTQELGSTLSLVNASPLRRIQLAQRSASALYERKAKAEAKVQFYLLVTLGGKLFLALSTPFFLLSMLPKLFVSSSNRLQIAPTTADSNRS